MGPVRQRQAEEARKPDRVDGGVLRLERAAEHFGPHVDAEGGLHLWPLFDHVQPGHGGGQPALMRALGGLLQYGIDHLRRAGGQRRGMRRAGLRPRFFHLRGKLQQRFLPDQPDRQQVGDGGVGAARKLCLPQQPARVLRPAANIHQQAVEHGSRHILCQAQPVGGAQDGAFRRVGGAGDMGAEPGQPGNLGRQVMRGPFAPAGKGRMAGRGRPERLAPVEIARRP